MTDKTRLLLLSALMSGAALGAQAEETEATTVSELSVTAQADIAASVATRLPAQALETPFTIVTITSEQLDNIAALSLTEALRYAATIGGTDNFGNASEFFSSRGFQLDNGNNYFRDGVRYRKYDQIPVYDLERVEVLRGPASILYGAVQPGGVVNLVTKKPLAEQQTTIKLRGGEYKYGQGVVDVTGPIGERFRYRVQGLVEKSDSYRDLFRSHSEGLTAVADYDLTPSTLLTFRVTHYEDKRNADRGLVTAVNAAGQTAIADLPRSRYLGEKFDYNRFRATGRSFAVRQKLGPDWELRVDTSFMDQHEDRLYIWATPTDTPVGVNGVMNRQIGDYNAYLKTSIVRAELAGKFDLGFTSHRILFGGETERHTEDKTNFRYAFTPINIYNPVYLPSRPANGAQVLNQPNDNTYTSRAIYVQDIIDVGDKLVLLAGLRSDYIDDGNNLTRVVQRARGEVTPQIGAVYRLTPDFSVYASFSRSFKQQGSVGFDGKPFDPQQGKQYEAGAKLDFKPLRAFATLSVYELEKTNVPVNDPEHPGFQRLSGLQRSRGAEASLNIQPVESLSVSLNYAYTPYAKFVRDNNLAGRNIRNVADHQLGVWAEYETPVEGLSAGLGWIHVGERWGNDRNQFRLPGYDIIDAAVRYRLNDKVEVSLNLKNLFDETYYTGTLEHRTVMVGQPRMLLGGITATF